MGCSHPLCLLILLFYIIGGYFGYFSALILIPIGIFKFLTGKRGKEVAKFFKIAFLAILINFILLSISTLPYVLKSYKSIPKVNFKLYLPSKTGYSTKGILLDEYYGKYKFSVYLRNSKTELTIYEYSKSQNNVTTNCAPKDIADAMYGKYYSSNCKFIGNSKLGPIYANYSTATLSIDDTIITINSFGSEERPTEEEYIRVYNSLRERSAYRIFYFQNPQLEVTFWEVLKGFFSLFLMPFQS